MPADASSLFPVAQPYPVEVVEIGAQRDRAVGRDAAGDFQTALQRVGVYFRHEAVFTGFFSAEYPAREAQLGGAALTDGQFHSAIKQHGPEADPDFSHAEL